MDRSGEQDERAEAVPAPPRQAGQIDRLFEVLDIARDKRADLRPWKTAAANILYLLASACYIAVLNRMPWPVWSFGVVIAALAVVLLLLAALQVRALRSYRAHIEAKIEDRGIIERLALGFHELPDIYAYTALPWQLFLGGKPHTLPHQVRLVALNLEWYLADQPRPYFRLQWLVGVSKGVAAILFGCVMLFSFTGNAWLMQGVGIVIIVIIVCLLGLVLMVILVVGMIASFLQAKQGVALDEMYRALKQRYGE